MKWVKALTLLAVASSVAACSGYSGNVPQTVGADLSGTPYVPLDGLPVSETRDHATCTGTAAPPHKKLLVALPDITTRFAVRKISGEFNGGFGPVATVAKGENFEAVLDFVTNDVVAVAVLVRKTVQVSDGQSVATKTVTLVDNPAESKLLGFQARVQAIGGDEVKTTLTPNEMKQEEYTEVTFPVSIGVGLRMTASVQAQSGKVTISSFGQISTEAGRLVGNLAVQSIGINGSLVSGAIPTPKSLDQGTIENGILAIGSARTALYAKIDDTSQVTLTPRVVGLYSPIGTDPRLINAIYSALAETPPVWNRPCVT
jgi:hypothetical protein